MDVATNFLREHVPDKTRIHYVITGGGTAPNVVPDFAEVYYYVRHPDPAVVKDVWARVEKAAKARPWPPAPRSRPRSPAASTPCCPTTPWAG
jgi:metal-dependent amidase/aminoacylase/carboxypeptidase family protein